MGGHRCFIRHLSTIDPDHMAQALELVVDFIWKNLPCENIRVEIYHIKDEGTGQIKADPHIKAVYAAKRFRWKTLTNDPTTGKRAQIMQLNNTDKITRNEPF